MRLLCAVAIEPLCSKKTILLSKSGLRNGAKKLKKKMTKDKERLCLDRLRNVEDGLGGKGGSSLEWVLGRANVINE